MKVSIIFVLIATIFVATLVTAEDWPTGHESMSDIQARIDKMREEQTKVRQDIEEMLAKRRAEHEERLAQIRAQHNIPSHHDFSSSGGSRVITDSDFDNMNDNDNVNIVRGSPKRGRDAFADMGRDRRRPDRFTPPPTPPSFAPNTDTPKGEAADKNKDEVHDIVQEEIARMRNGEITSEELSERIEARLKKQRESGSSDRMDADNMGRRGGAARAPRSSGFGGMENDFESARARRGARSPSGAAAGSSDEAMARAQEAMNRARQMREDHERERREREF